MLLFAVLALRDGGKSRPAFYGMLLSFSVAALLLGTAPPELRLPQPAQAIVRFMDVPNIVFVWWFGRSLFEDEFKLGPIEWLGFAAYSGPVALFRLYELGISSFPPLLISFVVDFASLGMMAHLAWATLSGRRDDLIEARRRLRVYFVMALAAAAVVSVVAENLFSPVFEAQVSTLRAMVALPIVAWGLFWLVRLQPDLLNFEPVASVTPPPPGPKIDPRDQALHARLISAMKDEKAYAVQGLTIRKLAERLGAPEHHLRGLINSGLGHRNFSAFVNHYRISAAKAALGDPEQARIPVLTIAMDVGYGSLAPFNRAFKAAEGVTPTEFRKAKLSGAVHS